MLRAQFSSISSNWRGVHVHICEGNPTLSRTSFGGCGPPVVCKWTPSQLGDMRLNRASNIVFSIKLACFPQLFPISPSISTSLEFFMVSPLVCWQQHCLKSLFGKSCWKIDFPLKIKIFNWLALNNKILTMENQVKRGCNSIFTAICVHCLVIIETMDHLLLNCLFTARIWMHYTTIFNVPSILTTMKDVWFSSSRNMCLSLNGLEISLFEWSRWNESTSFS